VYSISYRSNDSPHYPDHEEASNCRYDTDMNHRIWIAAFGLALLVGCQPVEPTKSGTATNEPAQSTPVTAPSGGGGTSVAPITSGAAGGLTPVTGAESVDGAGGGGMGQVAKDRARTAATNASTPDPMAAESGE
jgi:hypothetical protein